MQLGNPSWVALLQTHSKTILRELTMSSWTRAGCLNNHMYLKRDYGQVKGSQILHQYFKENRLDYLFRVPQQRSITIQDEETKRFHLLCLSEFIKERRPLSIKIQEVRALIPMIDQTKYISFQEENLIRAKDGRLTFINTGHGQFWCKQGWSCFHHTYPWIDVKHIALSSLKFYHAKNMDRITYSYLTDQIDIVDEKRRRLFDFKFNGEISR